MRPAGSLFVGNAAFRQHFGQAPVHDEHFAEFANHHVVRLEIPMQHASCMRERNRVGDAQQNFDIFALGLLVHQLLLP